MSSCIFCHAGSACCSSTTCFLTMNESTAGQSGYDSTLGTHAPRASSATCRNISESLSHSEHPHTCFAMLCHAVSCCAVLCWHSQVSVLSVAVWYLSIMFCLLPLPAFAISRCVLMSCAVSYLANTVCLAFQPSVCERDVRYCVAVSAVAPPLSSLWCSVCFAKSCNTAAVLTET